MKNQIKIIDALLSLRPGCQWTHYGGGYENLVWHDENELPPPTEEEVFVEMERLYREYENKQYQRDRKKEYPDIVEQLDILYHEGYDGWKSFIEAIKNKYPKPID